MYIFHDKKKDRYYIIKTLTRLHDVSGVNYDTLRSWFKRQDLGRVDRHNFTIVNAVLIRKIGATYSAVEKVKTYYKKLVKTLKL